MFGLLIKVVFWIINKVASIILAPILVILNVFVGSAISPLFTAFGSILSIMGNYVLLVVDLLCIPRELVYLLFTTLIAIVGFVVGARTYFFILTIYRKLKP